MFACPAPFTASRDSLRVINFHTQINKEVHMPEAIDYVILEDLIEKLGMEQVRCMLDEVAGSLPAAD